VITHLYHEISRTANIENDPGWSIVLILGEM